MVNCAVELAAPSRIRFMMATYEMGCIILLVWWIVVVLFHECGHSARARIRRQYWLNSGTADGNVCVAVPDPHC